MFSLNLKPVVKASAPRNIRLVQAYQSSGSSQLTNGKATGGYVKYIIKRSYNSNDEDINSSVEMVSMSVAPSVLPRGPEADTPCQRTVLNPLDARNVQHLEEVELPENMVNAGQQESNNSLALQQMESEKEEQLEIQSQLKQALQKTEDDLLQANMVIRAKDQELAMVHEELAKQEGQLRVAKSEIISTRVQMQERDMQLKAAYEALSEASRERSKMRQSLIETEQQLQCSRSHMLTFTTGLSEISDMMEALGDDVQELLVDVDGELVSSPSSDGDDALGGSAAWQFMRKQGSVEGRQEEEQAMLTVLEELSQLSETMSREAMEDVEVYFKASGIDASSLYKMPSSASTSDDDTVAPTVQTSRAREGVPQA